MKFAGSYMCQQDIADLLGVEASTVYRWLKLRQIKSQTVAGRRIIAKADFERFVRDYSGPCKAIARYRDGR